MANEQNLRPIPMSQRSKEDIQRITSAGGRASVKAKQEKKRMKELLNMMLEMKESKKNVIKSVQEFFPDILDEDITKEVVILTRLFDKATQGDIKAMEFIRDSSGQKPVDKQEINSNVNEKVVYVNEATNQQIKDISDHIDAVINKNK